MEVVISACAIFLALTLAASACHKLIARERLAVSAARLVGVAPVLGTPLSLSAATVEGLASAAILLPGGRALGAGLACALWSLYAALLFRRRGDHEFDCGCDFGALPPRRRQQTYGRAIVLASFALIVFVAQEPVAVEPQTALAALAFFGLNVAFAQLAALPSPNRSPAS